jgi:small-conductance mechanosensitive channel/CRP-like cAMP-binding protein
MVLGENIKLGALGLGVLVFLLLAIFRFTRQSPAVRDRIKIPLLVLFVLVILEDAFYSIGRPFPPSLFPYYLALIYLFSAILLIRLALLFFFDVFLVRSKKYRAPRLLKELSAFVLFLVAVVLIMQNTLHIQVTTVLATSALITVVLGLAMQETLGNLFAGLAIHLDPPFQVGDWIHVADIAGKVEEITWRATKLRTVNNDYIVIPNGGIAKEKLTNHSYPRVPHAITVDVGVSYHVPPNKVDTVVKMALAGIRNVVSDPPPDIRVKSFQDFSVLYTIKFWYSDYEFIEQTLAAVRRALWYHLRRHDVEIPFPVRNIFVHDRQEMLAIKERKIKHLCDSLRKVYLFADLAAEEYVLIAEHLQEQYYQSGEVIIREGEKDDSFFIIDQGEVEVYITSPNQHRKVLTTLHEGEFFGEIALLTGERRTASVQAMTDVLAYQLSKDAFKEVVQTKPLILDEIGTVLSKRKDQIAGLMMEITGSSQEAEEMTSQDAKSRILSRIRTYFGL